MEIKIFKIGLSFTVILVLVTSLIPVSSGGPFVPALSAVAQSSGEPLPTNSTQGAPSIEELYVKMAQLSASNKPEDIATLAYIWAFPLVTMERQFNYVTNENVSPNAGRGPANSISCNRDLINASYTDVVTPNSDALYCQTQFDLKKEPVVLVVPPIEDRYSTFQFLDAYSNAYAYLGERAMTGNGGKYLIAGPDWNGEVPEGMNMIWTPTNLAWLINRIVVKGPADLSNVHAIQDKIVVKPLSAFQGNETTSPSPVTQVNASKEIPIAPQPTLIPTTGIKIFDEIGAAMIGNPLNPPDPALVTSLASIGIGPGKVPSRDANDTIKAALQTGITEGQKMIDARVENYGPVMNGWLVNAQAAAFGTDYLFRAAATVHEFGANIAQEALCLTTFTDSGGKPLSGNSSYVIHFEPGQTPPVDAFWSITMYDDKGRLVDNPLNRYLIGTYTEGLKNNSDGSLDIYLQNASPGGGKGSNWLPTPEGEFNMFLRLYLPQPQILNGTWQLPLVQNIGM